MKMNFEDGELSKPKNKFAEPVQISANYISHPERKRHFVELEKFIALLDSSGDLVFIVDIPDGKIVDLNDTARKVINAERKEIIGRYFSALLPEESWLRIKENKNQFTCRAFNNSFRTILNWKNSFEMPVEITFSHAVFKKKDFTIIAARDITEKKKNEEALFNYETNFRTVFNTSRDAIIIHDADGNIAEVNNQMLEAFGVDRMSFQKFNIKDYFSDSDDYLKNTSDIISKIKDDSEQILYCKARKPLSGEVFFAETFLRKIKWYGKEQILAVIRNITETKKAEVALKESEEKYRLVFEKMFNAFCICEGIFDENEQLIDVITLDVNPAYEKMFNLKKEEVQGRKISDMVKLYDDYWFKIYEKVLKTGESVVVERYSIGWKKYLSVGAFKYKANQFAIVFVDITDRKKSEEIINEQIKALEAKNTEMESFTYTVSHDLRSPLITIKGFASILKEDIKDGKTDRVESDLERIEKAADKMQVLLEDLLELSRVGRTIKAPSEFSMVHVAYEVKELLDGIIEKMGIEFEIDENMPLAYGDKNRIVEVVQNLVENSVKFMSKKSKPVIKIGFTKRNDEIYYFVKDNGQGIEDKYQDKIFGLFKKIDQSTEGSGIGLAIVKKNYRTPWRTNICRKRTGKRSMFLF